MIEADLTDFAAIILAAGLGTRMRSERAKVLHELGGEPMLLRAMRAVLPLAPTPLCIVVGHQANEVEALARAAFPTSTNLRFTLQPQQRGTGHAARCGMTEVPRSFAGDILISYGDLPMLSPATLEAFRVAHRTSASEVSFITISLPDAGAYGRVVRDSSGEVTAIVEARDATPEQRAITEINTGVYFVDAAFLREALEQLAPNNAQGEYYLTDIIAIAHARGTRILGWRASDATEFAGINSREELAKMEAEIRNTTNRKLMASGVTFIDPATAYISATTEIGADTVIGPNVQILGASKIGRGVRIEGTAWLSNVTIGDRCHLKLGVRAEECHIGDDSEIGPFAHLRAGTELAGHNRIGNFVETKKARFGVGSKASHLSYLGDAVIGAGTNIGCGVITVNYDGYDKFVSEIGDHCMIGCDTQLVAPVKLGNDVYVASGTTIVREVPDGSLVLSHHPQRDKAGWTAEFHKRHKGRRPWWVEKGSNR
jgi:bifunctional UDP-N-acetylglucosamine pyrophosphorylase/glucosamine-1-phosphate N-acetyltransferase